jgi:hypothetical protein
MRICMARARDVDANMRSSVFQAPRVVVMPTIVARMSSVTEEFMRMSTSWFWGYQAVYSGLTMIHRPPVSSLGSTTMVWLGAGMDPSTKLVSPWLRRYDMICTDQSK